MSKRDELIEKYAVDLKEKCNVTADMDFLRKVTIGCGPSIYINAVMDQYGRSTRAKYRAVVYYLLAKHFNKESVYNK